MCDCQDDTPIKTHLVHFTAAVALGIHTTRMSRTTHTCEHREDARSDPSSISPHTPYILAYSRNIQ